MNEEDLNLMEVCKQRKRINELFETYKYLHNYSRYNLSKLCVEKDKEIERLNYLFYLFIMKLEHIIEYGSKTYYKENIKLVIEEMKRLKDEN